MVITVTASNLKIASRHKPTLSAAGAMVGGAAQLATDAVRADAWTIVDRLLEADLSGALLRLELEGGNSLLHLAAFSGSTNTVAVLLRRGACLAALNAAGQNAIDLAFLSGHDAVVEQLHTGAVSIHKSHAGGTSLAGQTDATSEVAPAPVELALIALPTELIVRIIRCMDIRDVLACSQVCRRFGAALDDAWLWESLCWSHWRCDSLQARRGLCTWCDVYKEQFVCRRAQARHREKREEERRAPRRERADEFGSPRIVASMATSIEELFEPVSMSTP
jgi:hypothetical protein